MRRISGLVLASFICLLSVTQIRSGCSANPMKIVGKPMFLDATVLCCVLICLRWLISPAETIENVAGDKTVAFVKKVLTQAGYSKQQINGIKILYGNQFCSTRECLYVPFNDEQLLRAEKYSATHNDKEGIAIAAGCIRKLRENSIYRDLSNADLLNLLQFEGKAVTRDSLDFWKSVIVHEMGHIVHKHTLSTTLVLASVGSCIAAYGTTCIHSNKTIRGLLERIAWYNYTYCIPVTFFLTIFAYVSGRLWRFHEKEADEEMIKRSAHNPQGLRATAQMFKSVGKLYQLNNGWRRLILKISRFFDSHPPGEERAQRLQEAYENIINQDKYS